jgi:hypothetical protein
MNDTRRILFQGVGIDVPRGWRERSRDAELEYVAPDETGQLLISVLRFDKPKSTGEVKDSISEQVGIRQKSVAKLSGGRAQLLPVRYEDAPAQGVTLVGADVGNKVQICTRIVGDSLRLATVSYYRYGDVQDAAGFLRMAEPVCRSLQLLSQ